MFPAPGIKSKLSTNWMGLKTIPERRILEVILVRSFTAAFGRERTPRHGLVWGSSEWIPDAPFSPWS